MKESLITASDSDFAATQQVHTHRVARQAVVHWRRFGGTAFRVPLFGAAYFLKN